mmetsp:Transcript_33917/g.56055  ORF Transcript_33917/g.56055 Transcript_33917/m.56055 type:complete len:200 (-) Transcript_33917:181-780(-)|eukprot:CAMPEP_0119314558 /NCGR_PEP_ID=MMETSP1333-20130426/33137_1 /TAXON_ID=418940 /ORGANISM="Scyphosphaera apsteinii, Strain RCC1455" /LENGTH=199 /DNA_ID=CAMNT_0007319691 /DNA_START=112 /DNA_END=711 /DNA_ORIENTATION=-
MAPKKKGKGKKDKKSDGGEGSGELSPQELLKRAGLRIESLEQQLIWREEKMAQALASQKELRERVTLYHKDFEKEKEEIFDIAADMTRQYKGMQEELLTRINVLENQINEQKDALELARLQLEEERRDKAQELSLKDAEIAEQKQKMEEMALEFGDMLKETLDKMGAQIDISNNRWEDESGVHVTKRLEEFKMGVSTDI